MKSNQIRKRNTDQAYEEGNAKTTEILNLIDQLHKIRLIEKIARPVDFSLKEKWFQNFKQKFIQLHNLMEQLRKDAPK